MRVDLRYYGMSGLRTSEGGASLALSPNLAREKVFFDGEIADPVRYREAMSALHEVVVGDLRFKKRDKTAYEAWKATQNEELKKLREAVYNRALKEAKVETQLPQNLESEFKKMHSLYWTERRRWAAELQRNDPALFRALVPCDPVVTVAPDVVFFECFAKDESAYGCLSVDRDAFRGAGDAGIGTTNVDYSLALYDHFQTLRSYRTTRLLVDPAGFEVKTEGNADVREEKIDLPPSWLRGFGQIQAAMTLPAKEVELPVSAVYSILAYLRRHREKTGPRSIRFELTPGKPPTIVLEPWNVTIESQGPVYDGPARDTVRVWGRRRLMSLARTLPHARSVRVLLLGSGLPSVWCADLGDMRFVLALSGWTANDWTGGTSLDHAFGDVRADEAITVKLAAHLERARSASTSELGVAVGAPSALVSASLIALAKRGQLVYDFVRRVHRYRPILPVALSETLLGPEPEEIVQGRLLAKSGVSVLRREPVAGGTLLLAKVGGVQCEAVISRDNAIAKAKCGCSHFFKSGLRRGPCRHLFALRSHAMASEASPTTPEPAPSPAQTRGTGVAVSIQWTKPARDAALDEAKRRNATLSEIVEQAWKIGRADIAKMTTVDPSRGDKVKETLTLDRAVADEIQREAARLDVSVGALVDLCILRVKETMKLTSSVLRKP